MIKTLLLKIGEWIILGVMTIIGLLGCMYILGSIIDTQERNITQLESCQKHALTPYDYHSCR